MKTIINNTVRTIVVTCGIFGIGCSSSVKTEIAKDQPTQVQVIKAPGIVEYAWEEPMVDVVDVPPGLDPEGHYYRPAHQTITEIRQGRWRYYQDQKGDQK